MLHQYKSSKAVPTPSSVPLSFRGDVGVMADLVLNAPTPMTVLWTKMHAQETPDFLAAGGHSLYHSFGTDTVSKYGQCKLMYKISHCCLRAWNYDNYSHTVYYMDMHVVH